jgi:AcrR family transcriptional regulator
MGNRMARPAQYSSEGILDAAAAVAAEHGPAGATMGAIARQLDAPTGSIYHRFRSKDVLLAELWLQTIEGFQVGFQAELAGPDPLEAGLEAALYTPRWVRSHPVPARLLLTYHRDDFVPGGWPPEVTERAQRTTASLGKALHGFARRALGATDAAAMRRVIYAVTELPYAAVQQHVRDGEPPPPIVDELVAQAYRGVMGGSRAD